MHSIVAPSTTPPSVVKWDQQRRRHSLTAESGIDEGPTFALGASPLETMHHAQEPANPSGEGDFLAGGGEMGALMRSMDWSSSPLGPLSDWPQSLRTTVSTCLNSRFPILIWWGPELAMLYNDAYRQIVGDKHPESMGAPGREVWPEIWDVIGPMLQGVLERGDATWSENQLLMLRRHGYPEECYFTFSYSPIRDESGGIGGVFCAVTETTERVVGERRMRTLRELSEDAGVAKTVEAAAEAAAEALEEDSADIPFSLLYLLDEEDARLVGTTGLEAGTPASPRRLPLTGAGNPSEGWPLARVASSGEAERIDDVEARFGALPGGPWDEPPSSALVLPVARPAQERPYGLLVVGMSPHRALDESYRGFFDLVAGGVATAIGNARAYEEERRRAEELAELDRAKTTFFSNVSHEFRTPLTLMLDPLHDLLTGAPEQLTPGQLENLRVAHRNALRLLRLVNTLLDFSRLEAGRIEASYEPTDLAAFTERLASMFRSAMERAGLRFVVDAPALPEPVYVDRDMWEKIVLNLVSNALKFTFDGEVEVTLRWDEDHVRLAVRDTGVGIPEEELPNLFDRFHQVEGGRARSQEGSGIGLSLVKELTELHGGRIEVESEVGDGSTFTVTIPAGTAHLPDDRIEAARTLASTATGAEPYVEEVLRWMPEAGDEDEGGPSQTDTSWSARISAPGLGEEEAGPSAPGFPETHGARILVADDNADMREYLVRLLGRSWDVEVVSDGSAALAAAREQRPDLVLADVMMPELDGFELVRALRAQLETRQIPVLLLSARAGEESRVEGLEAGADAYLVKPFGARELLARVGAHLALGKLREEALRAREQVLSVVSHDLRDPIHTIAMTADLLLDLPLDEAERTHHLEIIGRAAARMDRLVGDLLDLGKAETGRLSVEAAPHHPAEIVREAFETFEPQAIDRSLEFDWEAADPLPPVLADRDRILQVLGNLVGNAMKFTTRGGQIALRVDEEEDRATSGGKATEVRFSVSDTGPGISADSLPELFDPFWQGSEDSDDGSGLGLSIAKGIVEAHGGRIWAESDEGAGSTFHFTLPVAGPGETAGAG